ncbi:hypothetical protein, partial [Halopseudomonas oceani]|uniref:hypothetical protein n=1 Tax=Halopseudomonas oceani TaxID=1708783 RepID=UPI001E471BE1
MTPRQPEQRSEPEGPRSRVPGGIAKGGWASSLGGFKQSMQHVIFVLPEDGVLHDQTNLCPTLARDS